jgi:ABC-type transport system substrate-binding protein
MDPYTFLSLFYSPQNPGATGWWDAKYDRMLDEANNIVDPQRRYEKLAAAELYMMQKQIVVPLGVPGTSWLKKPYVKGLYPNPGTLHPWKFVYIERDSAKWDTDVENLLTVKDPIVQEQIAAITKSQDDFEKSKTSEKTAE